jgi:N-acetylglucosamine-6-sulfatase
MRFGGRLRSFILVVVVSLTAATPAARVARSEPSTAPNIVLILTDDQRYDQLARMPTVKSELIGRGVRFGRAFVVNPLCCPSRATILTGRYSHGTQVYGNSPPYGGFQTFHELGEESSTIATWLHDAGYHTALVGKYLNGYTPDQVSWVPPGWDRWNALASRDDNTDFYYDYTMSIDGQAATYGADAADYSTDVLAADADQAIRETPSDQPLFLYFAPTAPHKPWTPPPRYADACANVSFPHTDAFNEADVSDKPAYISSRPPIAPTQQANIDASFRDQCRALLAVDDAVGTILDALADTGRLSDTLLMFASDNGVALGEHRWRTKKVPYEEAIRVPLVVRYDPVTGGTPSTDHALVANIDFAPTFAAAAGAPTPDVDGSSLLPLLSDPATPWRTRFLIEHMDTDTFAPVPTYCALRNRRFLYVDYATGEEELYDLGSDPRELQNLAADPAWAAKRKTLHRSLVSLCDPPPPNYTP